MNSVNQTELSFITSHPLPPHQPNTIVSLETFSPAVDAWAKNRKEVCLPVRKKEVILVMFKFVIFTLS